MTYRTTFAALTLGTALAFGTAATAQNYFGNQMVADMNSKTITLNTVRAEADGFVVIYDYTGDEIGDELGSAPVQAGANSAVLVSLSRDPVGNVLAVLFPGEMAEGMDAMSGVAMLEIDVQN